MTTRRGAALLLAAALLLGACGDSDDGDSGPATSISVDAAEFAFTGDAWTVAADTDVKVTLNNKGSVPHEWAVLTEGTHIDSADEFNEEIVELEIEAIDAGSSDSITINLPAGTYQVICALEGHFDAGMNATLTVSG